MPELKSARRSSWYRAKEYLARAARTFAGVVEEVWDILKRKKRSRGKTRGKKGGPFLSGEWDYRRQNAYARVGETTGQIRKNREGQNEPPERQGRPSHVEKPRATRSAPVLVGGKEENRVLYSGRMSGGTPGD